MIRTIIYIGLITTILFYAYTIQENNQLEKEYHATLGYDEIPVDQALMNFQRGMVVLITPKDGTNTLVYKVHDFLEGYDYSISSATLASSDYRKTDVLALLSEDKLKFNDSQVIDFRLIRKQIADASQTTIFERTKFRRYNSLAVEADIRKFQYWSISWKVPIWILVLLLLAIFHRYFKKQNWLSKPYLLHLIAIIIVMYFMARQPFDMIYKPIVYSRFMVYFLSNGALIIVYIFYQIFLSKINISDFVDREALKFIVLFLLISAGIFLITNPIIAAVFKNPYNTSLKIYHFIEPFVFAISNLVVNVVIHLYDSKNQSERLEIAEAKALQSEAALSSIQSSINPHFLYNALNSIATLAKTDPIKTEKMTLALSSFYKYVTNREENTLSTIEKEIELTETYLEIEKIRFEERLSYNIDIQEELNGIEIPKFLIQPVVENAIKYGYDAASDSIYIKISIYIVEDQITIKIYDKGQDFDESLSKGYGLSSVSKKLQLLYPDRHEMSFHNNPKHVLITLKNTTINA